MHFRSRSVVAVGLFVFALGIVGPAVEPANASTWVWPTTGRITQRYGCTGFSWERPYGDCRHFHRGIDIANSAGTRVRAASSGVVTYVGYNPYDACCDRAWIVTIRHDDGVTGWYAHMQPKRVDGARKGDRVSAGDLIGYMGNTGRSTGVHLHFSLQRNGAPVNPMNFLDGRPSSGGGGAGDGASAQSAPKPTPKSPPKTTVRPGPTVRPAPEVEPETVRVIVPVERRYPLPI